MPEARLKPAVWIAEIDAALAVRGINIDIRNAWADLRGVVLHDGAWHKSVKELVVVPYNTLYGGWATNTVVGMQAYLGVSKRHAQGSLYWSRGLVMPGGFDSILAVFNVNTAGVFKALWLTGPSGDRGAERFAGGVVLDHKRIGIARSTDRLWYLQDRPYTCYLVSGHVDNSREGVRELGRIQRLVEEWVEAGARPIEVGFLRMPTTVSTMYVLT